MREEVEINCPFCGDRITVLVDPSVEEQSYIEDCSVCCRPIQISLRCEHGAVVQVDTERGS